MLNSSFPKFLGLLYIISHGFSKDGLEFEGKPRPTLEGSIRIMVK